MKTIVVALALCLAVPAVAAADQLEEIASIERTLWDAWGKADGDTFTKKLADDALMAVPGGGATYGRAAIAENINKGECALRGYSFSELKLRKLGKKAAMLSYKATQDASCGGQPLPKDVFVTAIYVKQGRNWIALTHQETVIQ